MVGYHIRLAGVLGFNLSNIVFAKIQMSESNSNHNFRAKLSKVALPVDTLFVEILL